MVAITKFVIFDEKMYHGNGLVDRWMGKIVTKFTSEAIRYAPSRSGELKAGISGNHHAVGVRQMEGVISSEAPHTMFVLGGTVGPIMTTLAQNNPKGGYERRRINGRMQLVRKKGYWMPIPAHNGRSKHFAIRVNGQDANNFMFRAWRSTARNHTSIRGVLPTVIRNL